ncbi:hypothetical protein F5876DRAFT_65617 [Lentinula aff. lateritia]|uniref:Uncharacterized protein n=1 Tax=Lentinula aff. lateritia TaxID=2804960 RepID=A0ACC1U0N6_9AGAR|nr:hypothetical protein F5876DRAFT_65617 [Lentinula aff. lateritia]
MTTSVSPEGLKIKDIEVIPPQWPGGGLNGTSDLKTPKLGLEAPTSALHKLQHRPTSPEIEDDTFRTRRTRLEGNEEDSLRHKNDTTTTTAEEHIDELDSRERRPLPMRRNMPEPLPSDHVRNPTHEDEYPYRKLTKRNYDQLEQKPAGFGIAFTNRSYPRPFIPTALLLKNMKQFQRDLVAKDRDNNKGRVKVSEPEAQSNKDCRDFGGPWAIILYDISAAFRLWLLDLGVVPLSKPGATFMVHSLEESKMSWILLNFTGPAVEEDGEDIIEALTEIKAKIFKDQGVQRVVQELVKAKESDTYANLAKKSPTEILATITSSLRLAYIPCNDQRGDPNPRYQLRGKPVLPNKDLQRKWVTALCAIEYNISDVSGARERTTLDMRARILTMISLQPARDEASSTEDEDFREATANIGEAVEAVEVIIEEAEAHPSEAEDEVDK